MNEVGDNTELKNFRPKPEFFESDPVASEIRNIVQRVVDAYYDFAPRGKDVGIVTDENKRDILNRLNLAYHDLEEFDVRENIHVGEDEDFFKDPRNMAEYVGGQILKLRHRPLTTDMEYDREVEYMNLENGIADPDTVWPDVVNNMKQQAGTIWTAESMLALPEQDVNNGSSRS